MRERLRCNRARNYNNRARNSGDLKVAATIFPAVSIALDFFARVQ